MCVKRVRRASRAAPFWSAWVPPGSPRGCGARLPWAGWSVMEMSAAVPVVPDRAQACSRSRGAAAPLPARTVLLPRAPAARSRARAAAALAVVLTPALLGHLLRGSGALHGTCAWAPAVTGSEGPSAALRRPRGDCTGSWWCHRWPARSLSSASVFMAPTPLAFCAWCGRIELFAVPIQGQLPFSKGNT